MITVLVVDDHDFVRTSLQLLLEAADDIKVAATASNGVEAVAQAISYQPDIAVMDISLPLMDGLEATGLIRERSPHTRIVMLSMYANAIYVKRALQLGASGYILKDRVADDLLAGIHAIAKGQRFFSQKISAVAEDYLKPRGKGQG